ncbi:hypothetical protein AB0B66_32535 [Catellatospora sp. NPDC049111]|uniref:hypothetical protein n=1 Tax=Catellatospora sp. NPDC049111 TaxID=3155271 RepID=UPI0033ED218F
MSDTPGYNFGVSRDPAADLLAIAVELESAGEAGYRIRAFRRAAQTVAATDPADLAGRAAQGTLAKLPGLGEVTARCVAESLAGEQPVYLRRLLATADRPLDEATEELHRALRDDCHSHSDWSDGAEPIEAMAAARLLRLAVEAGCLFAIDSDAHYSVQLDWLRFGCERAARCGVPVDRVVNTWPLDRLLAWTRRDRS